ncbi:putative 2-methylcitrate dehydratase (PrpD) [Aspergillus ibericus CBS 121593]|uniref:2-methylcitrate dehydratase PrpD n=1 Tax=Aspergillus ibericus CBS 121593 TaxID=1448316 RepID=A0A395GM12_9EURO|nr:2-methylcitrate dehydratase PrpD [Aspergillus ibericus CBS 121593]RAK96382.1 2-methylcitrate dehydratase PrpD [Aspergillus ibericus CBS 121593]
MPPQPYDQPIRDITNYIHHHPITDPDAYAAARIALLDALGCAIETASKSPAARQLLGPIVPGTIVPNGFKVPGTAYQVDPVKGAFDLGVLVRYLDHNDALGGMEWGHPSGRFPLPILTYIYHLSHDENDNDDGGIDNIPALLSITSYLSLTQPPPSQVPPNSTPSPPNPTLHTLLSTLIKTYEIQSHYQLHNAFNTYNIDHTILTKLASTALVSYLLGHPPATTHALLSHVWMDGHPSRLYRSRGTTVPRKGWAAGDACSRAVWLGLLGDRAGVAMEGVPGVLSGPGGFWEGRFGGDGFRFPDCEGGIGMGCETVKRVMYKVMPVEGHGIAAVEAALVQAGRMRGMGVGVEEVEGVEVRTTWAAGHIISRPGRGGGKGEGRAERDHCLEFVVAVALVKGGPLVVEDYGDREEGGWGDDPVVEEVRGRVVVRVDEGLTRDYLDPGKRSIGAGVVVRLQGGRVLEEVLVEYPVGHARNLKTREEVRKKFVRNMRLMFRDEEIEEVLRLVEVDDLKVCEFVDLFAREHSDSGEDKAKL